MANSWDLCKHRGKPHKKSFLKKCTCISEAVCCDPAYTKCLSCDEIYRGEHDCICIESDSQIKTDSLEISPRKPAPISEILAADELGLEKEVFKKSFTSYTYFYPGLFEEQLKTEEAAAKEKEMSLKNKEREKASEQHRVEELNKKNEKARLLDSAGYKGYAQYQASRVNKIVAELTAKLEEAENLAIFERNTWGKAHPDTQKKILELSKKLDEAKFDNQVDTGINTGINTGFPLHWRWKRLTVIIADVLKVRYEDISITKSSAGKGVKENDFVYVDVKDKVGENWICQRMTLDYRTIQKVFKWNSKTNEDLIKTEFDEFLTARKTALARENKALEKITDKRRIQIKFTKEQAQRDLKTFGKKGRLENQKGGLGPPR
jgi:hypothetical protein